MGPDPDAKIKLLAAEALRGVAGLVFDVHGNRFANELRRRDYMTGEMWKNKPPFRLTASDEIAWHCRHYTGRGIMKFYESCAALAENVGVPVSKMQDSVEAHCQASLKTAEDADAHPFDVVEKCAPNVIIGVVHCGEVFLLFPLSASSLRCVCVARSLSRGSSCPAGERIHTLGAKCCHIMSLFGL